MVRNSAPAVLLMVIAAATPFLPGQTARPEPVIRGSADNIMSRADSEAIARTVNQVHPGHARYLQIDDMTHGFTVNGKFHAELIPTILTWMREQLVTR